MNEGISGSRSTYLRIKNYDDKVLANAYMESFCVHARALFEFFLKDRGAKEYTAASYQPFVDGLSRASTIQRRLNNQVAHLLDGRTADSSKKIDDGERAEIMNILSIEIKRFKASLNKEHQRIVVPDIQNVRMVVGHVAGASSAIATTTSAFSLSTIAPPTKGNHGKGRNQ